MLKSNHEIDQKVIAAVIKQYDEHKPRSFSPEHTVAEAVKILKEAGVPDDLNAEIAVIQLGRLKLRTAVREMIGSMIQVEPLPQGAIPIYDEDLNVTEIITTEEK